MQVSLLLERLETSYPIITSCLGSLDIIRYGGVADLFCATEFVDQLFILDVNHYAMALNSK